MEDVIAYQFARNDNENVYLTIREYKQQRYIDLRVFYLPKDSDEMRPTKKGITVRIEHLADLKKGIYACEKLIASQVNRLQNSPSNSLQKTAKSV